MVITWWDLWGILFKTFFLGNFLRKFRTCFSRSNTLLDISQEWLVRLMWNKNGVHRLDSGWTMWPWPLTSTMTLTFDLSRSNFKIAVSGEWLSDWCETKRKQISYILGWLYGLALWPQPRPWTCSLKVKVWNSPHPHRNGDGGADWHGKRRLWVDHSWPCLWPMGNYSGVSGCTV